MLVERRAVEPDEPVLVDRKMRGHPIEDDADAGAVRAVDEAREAGRIAEARRRRVEAGGLVAPGRVVRVFGDGQEFDVGEAGLDHIVNETAGEFVP